jgi:exopolysaccharide production protein ExoQ
MQIRGDFSGMEAEMEGSTIDAIFLLVLIILGLRILYLRKADLVGVVKDNRALFIFYGFSLLSLLWADFPFIGLKRWIKWFGSLIMVLVILSEEDNKAAINTLIKWCAYALIPLSVIFNKFVPSMGRSYSRSGGADYHGVSTQKNDYGVLLLICGIYLAWELISAWREKDHDALTKVVLVNPIFLVIIFWQLFFIDSMTPTICLMLGIGIVICLGNPHLRKYPRKAVAYILVFAIAFVFLQYFINFESTAISLAGREPTLTARTLLWADLLKLQENRWVGTGWDNFWLGNRIVPLWEKWPWHPRSAHNGYLEIYLYLGWTGIILLCFVLMGALRKSAARMVMDFEQGCLSISFFIMVLLYNYSESGFHRTSAIWFFFMLFSFITIPKRKQKPAIEVVK